MLFYEVCGFYNGRNNEEVERLEEFETLEV